MLFFFFFNDTATTEIYTLSLHDALPISHIHDIIVAQFSCEDAWAKRPVPANIDTPEENNESHTGIIRSEEHTSELQSPCNLVCRLLLEKKKLNGRRQADSASTL